MDIIKEGTHTYLLRHIEYEKQQTQTEKQIEKENQHKAEEEGKKIEKSMLEYYLSVEYEILKRNSLKTLIPVQLREQDERKSLLFDITEKRSLKVRENDTGLSKKMCKKVLQSMISLIQEVEDYMLNLEYIEFAPEYIYEGINGEIQWIYFPAIYMQNEKKDNDKKKDNNQNNRTENLQNKIESLFEWMLTQIDYQDNRAVQFIYGIYNAIRKRGFSKELLERYLYSEEDDYEQREDKDGEYKERKQARSGDKDKYKESTYKENGCREKEYDERPEYAENISYEKFFESELEEMAQGKFSQSRKKQKEIDNKKGKKTIYLCLKMIFLILLLATAGLEGIWIFGGMTKGFTEVLFQYCIGGVFLIIAFTFGMLTCSNQMKKIMDAKSSKDRASGNQIQNNNQMVGSNQIRSNNRMANSNSTVNNSLITNRPLTVKTDVSWETEEGTAILNSTGMNYERGYMDEHLKEVYPMLRDMETGIVYIIKSYPFYIGSAEGVNQLTIPDKTVSREHAVILEKLYEQGEEGYILRDLDSTNGTWIDGKRMKSGSQKELRNGATIYFAKKAYKFLLS